MGYTCFTDEEFQKFMKKKDILLYKNNLKNVRNFKSDLSYKELLEAIIAFCIGISEFPKFTDGKAEATFEIIKDGLIENGKAYAFKCEVNRENRKKRNRSDDFDD